MRYCTAGTKNQFWARFWPPLGRLCGACLGTLAGQGWHSRPSGCLLSAFLGYALCGLGFETLPERKSDDFGTAFCAENMINNVLFVHFTVSPQSPHFLHFGVARGSHFGCLGPPFSLSGGPWDSHCCSAGVPGRLQKKACSTMLHSRYILVENGSKKGAQQKKMPAAFWGPFGDLVFRGTPLDAKTHVPAVQYGKIDKNQ